MQSLKAREEKKYFRQYFHTLTDFSSEQRDRVLVCVQFL